MRTRVLLVIGLLLSSAALSADEYFGEFLDKLQGIFVTDAKPRPVFKVRSMFRFKDPNGLLWSTPPGTDVDGASIPQAFWSFIGGPFEGAYLDASVIHDYYCITKERTAHDTHRAFYYGMRTSNVPEWKARLMYWAVATFGPDWHLEKRVVTRQACASGPAGATICESLPQVEQVMVSSPPIDLSDPAVLAAAISKANAVARTLLTSDGRVLDITDKGQVAANETSMLANAMAYRQVFETKDFESSPARLGLLSQPTGTSLGDIHPWEGNQIPKLEKAIVLTPQTAHKVDTGTPFKLDPRSKGLLLERLDLRVLSATVKIQSQGG